MSKSGALAALILGGIIGNLTAAPTEKAVAWVHEQYCPGQHLLAQGKALRERAIRQRLPALHLEANTAFAQAEACGTVEALAYRAQAYCFPNWGGPVDRRRYLQMLRKAVERGARLTPEWFLDPDVCPAREP